jgi:hypothetical protein
MTDVGDAPSASPCHAPFREGTNEHAPRIVLPDVDLVGLRGTS